VQKSGKRRGGGKHGGTGGPGSGTQGGQGQGGQQLEELPDPANEVRTHVDESAGLVEATNEGGQPNPTQP
jgi:hypothetical protein